ncbi:hypothetical protein AMS68_007860 [Peltaster fructicola]|uniref:Cdc23 domain-containing protein n=1 Tax=Peltaster fructicola TaxID=286661 RepID=A0A6H0Y5R5_9PEZI|nr:hypothetical protein AMS68_007860 [Peltaster fructicola]
MVGKNPYMKALLTIYRASELLNSFDVGSTWHDDGSDTDVDEEPEDVVVPPRRDARELRLEKREVCKYLLAKSFFSCREFDRCAAVFLPQRATYTNPAASSALAPSTVQATSGSQSSQKPVSTPSAPKALSQKSLFLALYAKYLSGEKRKNEDSEAILGPNDGPVTGNKELIGISSILEDYFNARGGLQNMENSEGWLDYLYGVVLMRMKSEQLAKQWLLRSVNLNPYNWSAWLELANSIGSVEEMQQIAEHLPREIITFFFHIYCSQELHQQTEDVYKNLVQIKAIFPRSAFLDQQAALLHYYAKDHERAIELFEGIVKEHPMRLDGLETYSNLLYVLPSRPKLAALAAMASDIDKFRPETNCILGNYYSLISEHEKAILHFRRALSLDRNFQSAWTLMGHEYIELKNHHAAVESYRRALDANRKDYRAWYGLGQGYEMLEAYSYSLFYYQRAAALCPGDAKMWAAVGNAYSRCDKRANAIQALKRALAVGSQVELGASFSSRSSDPLACAVGGALDPQILYEIALLYEREGSINEASAYMELTLAQEEGPDEGSEGLGVTQTTCRARLWLAKYSYSCSDWQRTLTLANELCQDGFEVEEAKSLVKDVRSRMTFVEGS